MKKRRKTITRQKLGILSLLNSRQLPSVINDKGQRFRWVGIGWVNEGKPTGREVRVVG